jgi:hypothetical protein
MYGLAANSFFRPMPGLGTAASTVPTGCAYGGTPPNCTVDIQSFCSTQAGASASYDSQTNVCTIPSDPVPASTLQSLCSNVGGGGGVYNSQADTCTVTGDGLTITYTGGAATATVAQTGQSSSGSSTSESSIEQFLAGGTTIATIPTATGSVTVTSNEALLGLGIVAALFLLPMAFGNR